MVDNSDSSDDKKESGEKASLLGEGIKKVFAAGVSAAFLTEENIRSYLGELKLPKEVLNLVLQSANKSKEEVTQRVIKEISTMLNKVDFGKELSKFAEGHKFKISAEIEITKKQT